MSRFSGTLFKFGSHVIDGVGLELFEEYCRNEPDLIKWGRDSDVIPNSTVAKMYLPMVVFVVSFSELQSMPHTSY